MKEFFKKYWLVSILLTLPLIFFPLEGGFSLHSTRGGVRLIIVGKTVHIDRFGWMFLVIPLWILFCAGLIKARLVCASGKYKRYDFYYSLISFFYLTMIFLFGIFFTRFIWSLYLINAGWAEIESAYRFARVAFPISCNLWPSVIFLLMYCDASKMPLKRRVFNLIFMLCFSVLVSFSALLLSHIPQSINESIKIAVEKQKRDASKSQNHEGIEPSPGTASSRKT